MCSSKSRSAQSARVVVCMLPLAQVAQARLPIDVMLRGHERACIEGSLVQPLATGNEAVYLGSYA